MNPEEKIQELELDIDALRALLAKMTPGPWDVSDYSRDYYYDGYSAGPAQILGVDCGETADAEGIAALRNAVPALLDELEQARQRIAELERENAELRARIDQLKSWLRADAAKRASRWVP